MASYLLSLLLPSPSISYNSFNNARNDPGMHMEQQEETLYKLPCPVESVYDLQASGNWDCVVLVCENLDWQNDKLDFLKEPINKLAGIDQAVGKETLLFPLDSTAPQSVVYAPTGPVNRDYDDVRRYYDAAMRGLKRAVRSGSKSPVVVVPPGHTFEEARLVSALGALQELYVPLEIREAIPEQKQKVDKLGVWIEDRNEESDVRYIIAVEAGRLVARDIGGSDPERMAAPKVAEYVESLFKNTSVKVKVTSKLKTIEDDYPLLAAVNRCASVVKRHQARVIDLEYVGAGEIDQTLLLVGKGVTYDTGGADIKAGGVMAGMHRDKCGAAAVAGFFQTLAKLQPVGIKVLGTLAMVRNSVGAECYVADELITSAAGVRVRVGNTDAEGRMAMADPLHYMRIKAQHEKNPHLMTVATLTGHSIRAVGPNYTCVMDNGPARLVSYAQKIQEVGHKVADPFELSTIRREDYEFIKGRSVYEDVLQCNNQASSSTPRGHQYPAAFLITASGLSKHGLDSNEQLAYTHMDIAGSSGLPPAPPTGAPVGALAAMHLKHRLVPEPRP